MPEFKTADPERSIATITYADGRVEQVETATPRMIYDTNRLGVMNDDIDAGFFMLWIASGKPGLNGHDFTPEAARPAMESWLDTVKDVDMGVVEQAGPPTKPRARSRG